MNAIQRKRAEYERQIAVIQAKLTVLAEMEADLGEAPAAPADAVPVSLPPPPPPTASVFVPPPPPLIPPPAAEVPPGKPVARPKREPTGERTTGGADRTRLKLLQLLAAHPDGLKVSELSERAGVGDNIVSYNLKHEWFEKSDPGYVRSPWVLTEAGESAAEKLSRTHGPAT